MPPDIKLATSTSFLTNAAGIAAAALPITKFEPPYGVAPLLATILEFWYEFPYAVAALLPGMLDVMNALFWNNAGDVPAALPKTLHDPPYDVLVALEFMCEGSADVEDSLNVRLEVFFDDCFESFCLNFLFFAILSDVLIVSKSLEQTIGVGGLTLNEVEKKRKKLKVKIVLRLQARLHARAILFGTATANQKLLI
jgi:hypothetical protein